MHKVCQILYLIDNQWVDYLDIYILPGKLNDMFNWKNRSIDY